VYKILEGQISFGGIHDALEAVSRIKNVKNGVLRITSHDASGLVGIFCGRFITGAVVTLTGEVGHRALRKLISACDGNFAFLDAGDEVLPDLKQSLGVDISLLLAAGIGPNVALTEETLTGMMVSGDEIQAIDTTMDLNPIDDSGERLHRIQRTYDRLLSLTSRNASPVDPTTSTLENAVDPKYESADAGKLKPNDFEADNLPSRFSEPREISAGGGKPSIPAWDVPYESPKAPIEETQPAEFKKLKTWSESSDKYRFAIFLCFSALVVLLAVLLMPKLLVMFKVH
jgi:hypothetical protein